MSIEDEDDLIGLQRIGRLIGQTLHEISRFIEPGMTTLDLDDFIARKLSPLGARSTPRHTYGFPGWACICVNDEAVHGVPGNRVLRPGDLVTVDLEADLDGYVADAARTVLIPLAQTPRPSQNDPDVKPIETDIQRCARSACYDAIDHARIGLQTRQIGRVVERRVKRDGFRVIRSLYGHGVGRAAHEWPSVPSFDDPFCRDRLHEGLVITIEPIISAGNGNVYEDGPWTIRTTDRARSAHHEETIVITRDKPIVLTAA